MSEEFDVTTTEIDARFKEAATGPQPGDALLLAVAERVMAILRAEYGPGVDTRTAPGDDQAGGHDKFR